MQLDRLDVGFSVLMLLAGMWVMAQAAGYGVFGAYVTGPGFFPFAAGALMTGATAVTLYGQIRRRKSIEATLSLPEIIPVAAIIALTAIFLVLVERIGILVLTPFYLASVSYFIERPQSVRQHLTVWLTAVVFTTLAYLLFGYTLRVPLPYGLFQQAY